MAPVGCRVLQNGDERKYFFGVNEWISFERIKTERNTHAAL